jgi:hypothetical protein
MPSNALDIQNYFPRNFHGEERRVLCVKHGNQGRGSARVNGLAWLIAILTTSTDKVAKIETNRFG